VLRRALFLCFLCALAFAGVASAMLTGRTSASDTPTVTVTVTSSTVATTTTTTTTTATTSTAASTTAPTSTIATTTKPVTTPATPTTTAPLPVATTPTTTTPPPTTTTSTAATTVVLNGHGWGHGLGMSQWGAYGYALHGWSYGSILTHYYSGTTLGTRPALTVRVLLLAGKKQVSLNSAAVWHVTDSAGTSVTLQPGKLVLTPDLTVNGQALVSPLTFVAGAAPLQVGASPYRGKLVVRSINSALEVVNSLTLESYLRGVVPEEMPANWPLEALKAQAVAARSYAIANLSTIVTASTFDLYSDERSQLYGGIAAETPATDKAVADTAHQVVLSNGKVATTYFFSSSGGQTASASDELGTAIPYLVSVPDPYDTLAPHHNWGPVLFSAAQVAKAIKLPGTLLDLVPTIDPTDARAHIVTATGTKGQLVVSGPALREDLGLRSTWFTVGWLALTPQPAPLIYGTATAVTGLVRGVADVVLEERPAGGAWRTVAPVKPDSSGAFSMAVTPEATTQFRLTAGTVHAALVKVTVVPLVTATLTAGSAQGTVRPAAAGSPVQLQRQDGSQWTTVATGTTDASGAFQISAPLASGSYRVRCVPGAGLSPGVSGTLPVQ
jgi:SpoIID/LytB domain protein